jgi:hypothetical protein
MAVTITVTGTTGVSFKAVMVRKGERYGRTGALTCERDMIEFYDTRYPHTVHGQFVARYYVESLREHGLEHGLALDPACADWRIGGDALASVNLWARPAMEGRARIMSRHEQEQAIAADLALCDIGLALTKGKVRKRYVDQRKACLDQIRAWNRADGLADISADELLAELGT